MLVCAVCSGNDNDQTGFFGSHIVTHSCPIGPHGCTGNEDFLVFTSAIPTLLLTANANEA